MELKDLKNMYFYGDRIVYILGAKERGTEIDIFINALKMVPFENMDDPNTKEMENELAYLNIVPGVCQAVI